MIVAEAILALINARINKVTRRLSASHLLNICWSLEREAPDLPDLRSGQSHEGRHLSQTPYNIAPDFWDLMQQRKISDRCHSFE